MSGELTAEENLLLEHFLAKEMSSPAGRDTVLEALAGAATGRDEQLFFNVYNVYIHARDGVVVIESDFATFEVDRVCVSIARLKTLLSAG